MRTVFAGAALFSIVGSVVFGGALAWNSSVTLTGVQATIGDLEYTANYNPAPNALLGPDGATTTVGNIDLQNTGDFNLGWDSALVIPKSVDALHPACDVSNFSGQVSPNGAIVTSGIAPNVIQANAARVMITVKSGAPVACAGGTLTFDIVVTLKTLPNAVH
jgi:hypothetical protein